MIEDLQDEYSLYTRGQKSRNGKARVFFVFLGIWLVYAAVVFFTARPRIRQNLKDTNAVEILKDTETYRQLTDSETAVLWFYSPDGGLAGFESQVRKTGASVFHNVLEGLLSGPPDSALSEGAVSFIPKGTVLKGVTVSGRTAFVDLSGAFVPYAAGAGAGQTTAGRESTVYEGTVYKNAEYTAESRASEFEAALEQILRTLQSADAGIEGLVLLADSSPVHL